MKRFLLSLGLSALLAGCVSVSGVKEAGVIDSGTSYAKDALQKFVDSGEMPGAICVYYDKGIQETACIGYADVSTKRPITIDDHYMQCSQTKGFCGVTIAILVEEGKLSLDDPVSKYLPEFKELWIEQSNKDGVRTLVKAKNTLTVRMVMNHTGGFGFELPKYTSMGGWSRRMPLRSVAVMASSIPIAFEPGTKAKYSNVGIDIGAAVVEVITGKRWENFLQERVLDPLGMKETTFWPTAKQLSSKIEIYNIQQGQPAKWVEQNSAMQKPYNDDRVFSSAGAGLWTTVRDQLKFYKMLMNLGVGDNGVRILKEETVKSILATSTRPQGLGGYSLGLNAPVKDGEEEWFGHGGAWQTSCYVNWHKKQLKLFAVQYVGKAGNITKANREASDKFFKDQKKKDSLDEYTGRME